MEFLCIGDRGRFEIDAQERADDLALNMSLSPFPPATSKWNSIEHRMFCHITVDWAGGPLVSRAAVLNLIGHTATWQGLRIKAQLDKRK